MPDDTTTTKQGARIDNGCSEHYTAVPLVHAIAASSSSSDNDNVDNNSHNVNDHDIGSSSYSVDTEFSGALTSWSASTNATSVVPSSATQPTQHQLQQLESIDINGAVSYLQQMAKLIGPSNEVTSVAALGTLSNAGTSNVEDEDNDGLVSQGEEGTNVSCVSIMTEMAETFADSSGGIMRDDNNTNEDTMSTTSTLLSIATEIIDKKQQQQQHRIVESSSKSSTSTVHAVAKEEEGGVKKKRQIKSSFIARKVSSSKKNKKNKQQQHDHSTQKKKKVPKRSSIVKQFFSSSSSSKKAIAILPPVVEEEKSSDISHAVANDVPLIETAHTDGTTNLRIEVVRDENGKIGGEEKVDNNTFEKVMDNEEAGDHAKGESSKNKCPEEKSQVEKKKMMVTLPRSRSKSIQQKGDTASSRSRSKSIGRRGNKNSAESKKTANKEPHDETKDVKTISEQETTSKKFVIRSPIQLRSPVVIKSDKEYASPPDDTAKAVASATITAARSLQPNGIPNNLSHKELKKMAIEAKKAEKQRKKVEKQEAISKAKADREVAKLAELKEKLALQEMKVQEASAAVSQVKNQSMKPSKSGETKKMTLIAKNAVAQAKAELKEAAKADREAAKLAELKGMLVAQEARMDETSKLDKPESNADQSTHGSSISSVGCKTWTTDGSISAYAVAPSVGQAAKFDNKTSGYKILKNSKHNIKLGRKGKEVAVPMEVLLEEESKPKNLLFGNNSKSFSECDARDDEDRDDGEANWDYSNGFHYTNSPGTPRDDNADGGEEVSDVIGGWISEVTNFVDGFFDATDTALIDGTRMQEVDAMESMKRREVRRLRRASKAKNPTIEYNPSDVKCPVTSRVIVDDFADDESEESFMALARYTGMFS